MCGQQQKVAVLASTVGPISFAYCEQCLEAGAEPYWALVSYIAGAGEWPDGISQAYQDFVRRNLQYHQKSEEEFASDVKQCIDEMNEMWEDYLDE